MMKIRAFIKLIFSFNSAIYSQKIDNELISINLSEFYDAYSVHKNSRGIFIRKTDKVVLFESALVQKLNNKWVLDLQHLQTGIFHFPDTLNYFVDSSKIILMGWALNDLLEQGKVLKCASFRIETPLTVGETATFRFKILSDWEHKEFCPKVYLSNSLYAGRKHKILNRKKLKYEGILDKASTGRNNLVESEFSFVVDKKNRKYQWIHLVVDHKSNQIGYVVEYSFKTLNIDSIQKINKPQFNSDRNNEIRVFFQNASDQLTLKDTIELDNFLKSNILNKDIKIELSGFADRSGNLESNMILASRRVGIIREYLENNGINPSRITIAKIGIANFGSVIENRVCIIKWW